MANRKPSVTTELRNAKTELDKVKNELESLKSQHKWATDARSTAENEPNQIHAFLDAVPNPPADKVGDYGQKASAMTRLAVYLATRSQ